MTANSLVRNALRRALVRPAPANRCGISSQTSIFAAPFLAAQSHVVHYSPVNGNSSFDKTPASGWKKTIVSSADSLNGYDSLPSQEQIAFAKKELERTAASEGLKLEVDMEELQRLASLRCTPLSLRDMYKYAVDFNDQDQRLRNAQFLHRELPIRIAQRAVDLLTLPHGFCEALPIQQIAHVYLLYLEKFQECPVPTTPELEAQFTDMLQNMVLDRASIPIALARGVDAWLDRPEQEIDENMLKEMDDALYRFFTARVGLRFLTEHHILSAPYRKSSSSALRKAQSNFSEDEEDFLGCIQTDCCPKKEVEKVVKAVTRQTEEHYGFCPEIQIVSSKKNKETKFTYVPHHLHYMVGELVKNSCRATVRKYLESEAKGEKIDLPPIRIVIVKGKEDVTIKVADRGGGIPRSKMATIFRFAHSTAGEEENSTDFGVDEMTGTKIRGFGLPLARIYARYLGGELTLKSMEGYGLDAYLHLPRLGDACENLPLPVKFSPGELNSNAPRKAVR